MVAAKLISVSIVSHRQIKLIMPLLTDLATYCANDIEVILTINVPETIPPEIKDYRFIKKIIYNAQAKGFATNHNNAFQHCNSAYYCVLNPDIRLQENPFTLLMSTLTHLKVGVVAALMLDEAGAVQDNARKFPTLFSILKRIVLKKNKADYSLTNAPLSVDWVGGMFMLFRSTIYQQVHGFDERFFLYFEDVDLCGRLRALGHEIIINPQVKVIHNAQRRSHRNLRFLKWHVSSMLRYFYRYYLTSLYSHRK